jgi:DNA invertase Pin-like site-specific DNA recombinase
MDNAHLIYCLSADGEAGRLNAVAETLGLRIKKTLTDSQATPPGQRPGYATLCRMVAVGNVQTILVPCLAMLGAGLDDLVAFVSALMAAKVELIAADDEIDTRTPDGRAWMVAIASLQRYQTGVKRQKVRAGQLRAQNAGVKFGRPRVAENVVSSVRAALAAGHGVRPTARRMGISPARVAAEKTAMSVEGGLL